MTLLKAPAKETIDVILKYAPKTSTHQVVRAVDVSLFIEAVYATDFMAPFDWMNEFPADSLDVHNRASLLDADGPQLRKLLIAHLRLDRFLSGHLERLVQSGYLDELLAKLKALHARP